MIRTLEARIDVSPELPPIPADPRGLGRHVSWVVLAQSPHFHYGDERIDVDDAWIGERLLNFSALLESKPGWLPPVLISHRKHGERVGDFFELRSVMMPRPHRGDQAANLQPVPTLLGAVAWADDDAEEKIKTFRLTHVSVGLHLIQRPDTGEWLYDVPVEVSQTTVPHLGEARILNEALGMDEEQIAALVAENEALKMRVEELMAEIEAMKPDDGEEEPEEMAAVEEPAEMSALRQRVAELEAKTAAAELSAHTARIESAYKDGVLEMSALVSTVAELTFGNEELLNKFDAAFKAAESVETTETETNEIPEVLRKRLTAASVGRSTTVPQSKEDCFAIADAECGGDPKKRLEIFGREMSKMEALR